MGREHRRHQKMYASECAGNCRKIRAKKHSGWNMNLYRNTREGKVAGVCAGLADHWDIAHWLVRLLFIGACLFTGMLAVWVYIGAWVLIAPRSLRRVQYAGRASDDDSYNEKSVEMEYDERSHDYRPKKVFRYSDSGTVRLKRARERLDAALQRVEGMESYVTSRQYNLNNEFSKL